MTGTISIAGKPAKRRQTMVRVAVEAAIWGAMMLISALAALRLEHGRSLNAQTGQILAIYFTGAYIAYAIARPALAIATARFALPWRFLFAIIVLTGLTLGATAGVLALDYRAYYSEWHSDFFSIGWFYQQAYTILGSTYQYLVIGTRLYLPLGPLFLVAASWWLARKAS